MRIAMSSSNLVHSPPTHILCLTPCVKARTSFRSVLPCLVRMYHQTNLDCKSFSISEDLAETIVVWPWTSQNYISEWYSGWWWCITILSLTNQWYCPGKHLLKSSEPSLWPWPWIQQSNLFTRHSSLRTCTVKLSWSPQKISSSEHITETVIFDCMNRNSVTETLTLKTETHFLYMTLWIIMMSHHTGSDYKWFSDA